MAEVDPKEWAAAPWRTVILCSREDVLDILNEQLPGGINLDVRKRVLVLVDAYRGPGPDIGPVGVACDNSWQVRVVEQVALRTGIPLVGVLAAS